MYDPFNEQCALHSSRGFPFETGNHVQTDVLSLARPVAVIYCHGVLDAPYFQCLHRDVAKFATAVPKIDAIGQSILGLNDEVWYA